MIMDPDDKFDWSQDGLITVPAQLATAVYTNGSGGVVIRQENDGLERGDTIIILTPSNARKVSHALRDTAAMADGMQCREYGSIPGLEDDEDEADPAPANDTEVPEVVPPLIAAMREVA